MKRNDNGEMKRKWKPSKKENGNEAVKIENKHLNENKSALN